jgi:hypothetical protein
LAMRFSWEVLRGFFFASLCRSRPLLMVESSENGDSV